MSINGKRKKRTCVLVSIILVIFGGTATMGIINYSKNYGYANKIIRAMDDNDFERFNNLLEKRGNINSKRTMFSFAESNDMSPLRYACWLNKFDFVESLLIRGADPNFEKVGTSILTLCLVNAKKDTEDKMLNAIKLLIEYGADVNYRDKNGNSVLSRVEDYLNDVYKNIISDEIRVEIIKLLVDSDAQ